MKLNHATGRLGRRGAALIGLMTLFGMALPRGVAAGLGDTIEPNGTGSSAAAVSIAPGVNAQQQVDPVSGAPFTEYAAAATNKVFAISWSGARIPDLKNVFGTYFDEYTAARAQQRSRSLHIVHVATPNLVVDMSGINGAFSGSAWSPALVPAGVNIDDLLK